MWIMFLSSCYTQEDLGLISVAHRFCAITPRPQHTSHRYCKILHISLTHYMWATELGPWLMQWLESREDFFLAYSRHLYLVSKPSCLSLTLLGPQLSGWCVSSKWTDSNSILPFKTLRRMREIYTDMTWDLLEGLLLAAQAGDREDTSLHRLWALLLPRLQLQAPERGGWFPPPYIHVCMYMHLYLAYIYTEHRSQAAVSRAKTLIVPSEAALGRRDTGLFILLLNVMNLLTSQVKWHHQMYK